MMPDVVAAAVRRTDRQKTRDAGSTRTGALYCRCSVANWPRRYDALPMRSDNE